MQAGSRMEHAPTICRVSAVAYVSISNICRTTVYFAHLYACACGEGTPPAIRRSIRNTLLIYSAIPRCIQRIRSLIGREPQDAMPKPGRLLP